jgi:hypothetical protein
MAGHGLSPNGESRKRVGTATRSCSARLEAKMEPSMTRNRAMLRSLSTHGGLCRLGGSVSFVHCGQPAGELQHTALPCFAKATEKEGSKDKTNGDAYRFKRLNKDWFIYEESN